MVYEAWSPGRGVKGTNTSKIIYMVIICLDITFIVFLKFKYHFPKIYWSLNQLLFQQPTYHELVSKEDIPLLLLKGLSRNADFAGATENNQKS